MKSLAIAVLVLVCSCANSPREQEQEQETPQEFPKRPQGIARIVVESEIVVVLTTEDNRDKLSEVISNTQTDFHWVAFSFPKEREAELTSEDGVQFDLSSSDSRFRFSQVYRETCNPALEDFRPCWIHEQYTSGESGLSGRGKLRLANNQVIASYEIGWEGITSRFGAPAQRYSHSTYGAAAAALVGE